MAGQLKGRNFLKKAIIVSLLATVMTSIITPEALLAQEDDFNTRIIQDYISAMHLYRDKLLNDKYRSTYHFVIPTSLSHYDI